MWVPASAARTSPLQLMIEAKRVTCVNGAQRAESRQLEQCCTGMGRDVTHGTIAMGDSPCMIALDASQQQATVGIDGSSDTQLRAHCPFGTAALKHCP